MPRKGRVTGGKVLAKTLKEANAAQKKMLREGGIIISVGFHEKLIAVLAAQLEFGNPNTNLPERPAFRIAVERIKRDLTPFVVKERLINPLKMVVDDNSARRIATWCVDVVKEEYHSFDEPAEGERQRGRKGFSDPLVGKDGPKLIENIAAEINGQSVN